MCLNKYTPEENKWKLFKLIDDPIGSHFYYFNRVNGSKYSARKQTQKLDKIHELQSPKGRQKNFKDSLGYKVRTCHKQKETKFSSRSHFPDYHIQRRTQCSGKQIYGVEPQKCWSYTEKSFKKSPFLLTTLDIKPSLHVTPKPEKE